MKTKTDENITYVCLENKSSFDFGGGKDYEQALKLHYDHYQKVLEAKKKLGLIPPSFSPKEREDNKIQEREMKEGDFVYLSGLTNMSRHYGKPVYGWVMKDDEGKLYVQSYKLVYCTSKRGEEYTYIPEKYYLKKRDGSKSESYMSHKILFTKHCNAVQS